MTLRDRLECNLDTTVKLISNDLLLVKGLH